MISVEKIINHFKKEPINIVMGNSEEIRWQYTARHYLALFLLF